MEKDNSFRQSLINELLQSRHGDLPAYIPPTEKATQDPEFLSKLMVWNLAKGEIRDTKIALPIIALHHFGKDERDLAESAMACLCSLDPRSLVKAYRFKKTMATTIPGGNRRILEQGLRLYLTSREENQGLWDRVALQHKHSLKELYAVAHQKPSDRAQAILFDGKYPKGSVFEDVARLKSVGTEEAAGIILNRKIPFQIAIGALGRKKEDFIKSPELPLALMSAMSGQQLLASTKMLQSLGVFSSPMLQSEYNKALERAKKDKRVSTLKADKAAKSIVESATDDEKRVAEKIAKKLSAVQEEKLAQKTIEGDWAVFGDRSGSMREAIKLAVELAAYITKSVKGNVYLIFCNETPRMIDVTGKTLTQIQEETKRIDAGGATCCGCGLWMLADKAISIDGIAMVSDGGENRAPAFGEAYVRYANMMKKSPTVYFYKLNGDRNVFSENCRMTNVAIEEFDMTRSDYYSMPNMVAMMKTTRYGLIDEIMNTELLTFKDIFEKRQLV
jgi:hypothetical protein